MRRDNPADAAVLHPARPTLEGWGYGVEGSTPVAHPARRSDTPMVPSCCGRVKVDQIGKP